MDSSTYTLTLMIMHTQCLPNTMHTYIGWSHFIPMHLALLRGPRPGVLSRLAWHMDRAIALDLMAELVASPYSMI